jgi:hypothetical protein
VDGDCLVCGVMRDTEMTQTQISECLKGWDNYIYAV